MTDHQDARTAVEQTQAQWAAAFNAENWQALANLYHLQAHLYGGRPALHEGRDGILAYFSTLPRGARAMFKPGTSVIQLDAHCIIAAGVVDFQREGRERLHRISWTLVPAEEGWRIASHHASQLAL